VTTSGPGALLDTLREARRLGFLGPGPLEPQIEHALGFADALDTVPGAPAPGRAVDLGSGGGLPGLVLAGRWPGTALVLVEAGARRSAFLAGALARLGLEGRVSVVRERAEVAGRDPALRGHFDLVVSRSFGPPSVTAECAAPFLRPGGVLVASGPPGPAGHAERWPPEGLAQLGLGAARQWSGAFSYEVVVQLEACGDRFPRRTGIPAKRPLF
jgi:16S rRNA (guanine527-N7)-methyltransferase